MAAPCSSPRTPKRIYCLSNSCCLCSFSFVIKEIGNDGNVCVKKLYKLKLRLTDERRKIVKQVVDIPQSGEGVCIKCFAKCEKVIKHRKEIDDIIKSFQENRRRFVAKSPGFTETLTKRGLRSPQVSVPESKITRIGSLPANVPSSTQYRAILPHPDGNEEKPARKSLCFNQHVPCSPKDMLEEFTDLPIGRKDLHVVLPSFNPLSQGEVEVSVNYPSGKKTALITSPPYKAICKAMVDHKEGITSTIVNILCQSYPAEVVKRVSKIIDEECSEISKRGSMTGLQGKCFKDFSEFSWETLYKDLNERCPHTVQILSSIVNIPSREILGKSFYHLMVSCAIGLHGRNQEMSAIQYVTAFILARGGCTQRSMEVLCKFGLSVHPYTVQNKLKGWEDKLDEELKELKEKWVKNEQPTLKFQLVGDNWDMDILPSYRTTDRRTQSLHLFQIYAIVDRYTATSPVGSCGFDVNLTYIPSVLEQKMLLKELTFIFATAIIKNIPQVAQHLEIVYPKHLQHKHSHYAAIKTKQYPLGLFDTNENKTDEMIRLLKDLTDRYVPLDDNDDVVDAVFFGGDRLTDERVQCAQVAKKDSSTAKGRLEGFISKSEDFHRLMNLMEAIYKLTYSVESAVDPCTVHYYRNILGHRNVKGPVKNAYRAYKLLYYTIGDAICVAMFRNELGSIMDVEDELLLPDLSNMSIEEKKEWINGVCEKLVKKWFFEDSEDVFHEIRDVLENPHHEENYWTSTLENGRFKCHHCTKDYKRVSSLKAHESEKHKIPLKRNIKNKRETKDEVHCYVMMLFKLIMLHRNFDSAVDMGDGTRCVRSAKYELPIYHKTHKIKYTISSIHTIAMSSGLLNPDQEERFIANRFVNLQGGVNSNIALDEYIEMINRDTKASCTGHKTKESILHHSKEYPLLVQLTNQLEAASNIGTRKGFHHLPSYCSDVQKVAKDLLDHSIFCQDESRKLNKKLPGLDKNPFLNCTKDLSVMLHRHRPLSPYGRLRDSTF